MDLYHALNRGVDKRQIFLDDQDRARFVHDIFEFNTTKPANNITMKQRKMNDFVSRSSLNSSVSAPYVKLVDLHGWCLMGNHYHLLLSERIEGGLVMFLRKLNIGYAKYFNERYKRTGTLFQGRTKKLLIDNDAYFLHILNYIHLNPLDFFEGSHDWRERKIFKHTEALKFLSEYRWSSYQDYIGIKNFPSILTTSLFKDVFGNNYAHELEQYLKDIDLNETQYMFLEKSSD